MFIIKGMTIILGLDVSTSCVGVAVLSDDEDPPKKIYLDHILFKGCNNLLQKAVRLHEELQQRAKLLSDLNVKLDAIYIEDAAKKFASGRSSASVIATLMRFNGIATFISWQIFNIEPNYIAPTVARTLCGLKMQQSKKCGKKHKQQVFDTMMETDFKGKIWPTKQRSPNIVDWAYDIIDAYVVSKAALKFEQSKSAV